MYILFMHKYSSSFSSCERNTLHPAVWSQQCQYPTPVGPSSEQWRHLSGQLDHQCDWDNHSGTNQ